MRKLVALFFALFLLNVVLAQNNKQIQKANELLSLEQFAEALPLWEIILQANPLNHNHNFKYGLCLFNIPERKSEAFNYFKKASESTILQYNFFATNETNAPYDVYYFLGESYLLAGNTDKALENFLEYSSFYDGAPPIKVEDKISKCYNTMSLKLKPRNAEISNLSNAINTNQNEISPIMSWDETVFYFASNKDGNLDIFQSVWNTDNTFGTPEKLSFNSDKEEYPVCISADNQTLFFARNDDNGYNLYKVKKKGDSWEALKPLDFNTEFNEIGLTFTFDEKYAFIASDKKDGNGGYDIYMSRKNEDGSWGELKNLSVINTLDDEVAPFMNSDGKSLFFSSNHEKNGLGGFDIYFTQKNEHNLWMNPINLGFPINSPLDDYYYNAAASPNLAYYASHIDYNFEIMKIEGLNIDSLANEGEYKPNQKTETNDAIVKIIKEVEGADLQDAIKIVADLDVETASKVIDQVEISKAVGIMDGLETTKAISIMDEVPVEKAIDVVNGLNLNKTSDIIEGVDIQKATGIMDGMEISKAIDMFETIEVEKATGILEGMEPNKSSKIVQDIPVAKAIDVLDGMKVEKSVGIVEKMEIEKAIGVFNEMDNDISKNIVGVMQPSKAAEVMNGMQIEKAVTIAEEIPIEKAISISENMDDTRSSDILSAMDNKKAVQIIESIPVEKAIKVLDVMDDQVAIGIIEDIEIEKAVEVLGGMEEEKGKRIVDNLQSRLDEAGSEKIMALLKKYFAGQISEMESYIFKQVYFDFNSAELNLMSRQELLMLVEFLAENPFVKIEVVGHTDNTGDWDVNLRISGERANVVYKFLRDNKIAHDRIIFYGKGSAQPIASNETDAGRKMNRRVEVILLQ